MTLSPHFPEWLLLGAPYLISILKLRVPPIWRELLVAGVAIIGTAIVVVVTPLTFAEAVSQGAIWFLMLAGTWQLATGTINAYEAKKANIPPVTATHRIGVGLLLLGVLAAGAWADSTAVATGPVKETVRETANLWILLGMQYLAKLLDRFLKV